MCKIAKFAKIQNRCLQARSSKTIGFQQFANFIPHREKTGALFAACHPV
tara:strand:+ start:256 stop:402 length:147 start_codon:yes stop_codon:yes gene_type:complete